MNSTTPRRSGAPTPPRPSLQQSPRRFAFRLKGATVALSAAGFGLAWALVSTHVVGATNATPAPAAPAAPAATTAPGRVPVPSSDFFGAAPAQPQPIIGNGGGVQGGPVVRSRTS